MRTTVLAGLLVAMFGILCAGIARTAVANAQQAEKKYEMKLTELVKANAEAEESDGLVAKRSFTVTDAEGKAAIVMSTAGNTNGVWIYHPNGKGMVGLFAGKGGEATVGLWKDYHKDVGCRFAVTLEKNGDPYFQVVDSQGKIHMSPVKPPEKKDE